MSIDYQHVMKIFKKYVKIFGNMVNFSDLYYIRKTNNK